MKRVFIFGGGVYGKEFPEISEGDYVIAADKGVEILNCHGITPDLTVGDFDSSSYVPEKNVIVLPVEKDVTDTHAAVDIALEKGAEEIVIYGGMGGRPDHTLANISLIASLVKKGIKAFCVGEGYTVTGVSDGNICVSGTRGKTFSVFSWSEKSEGVTLNGLKYTLEDAVLTNSFALGVSNSFSDASASVTVKKGTLIIMYEN